MPMSSNLRVLVTDVTNPYFNLATEDWIFHDMSSEQSVLFVWRNEPCIVVGRGQNVWSECRLDQVEQDGVHVVRRPSGGGAVYQDLGNTCFTFMGSKERGQSARELYARNNKILLATLRCLGIEAEASGRNDLTVALDGVPHKISGSAFKEARDRCFHHGTMLMNVALGRLAGYLTPNSRKLKAKGVKSVAARVVNLDKLRPGLDHFAFSQALIEQFFHHHQERCQVERLTMQHLDSVESLQNYYQRLQSWDWVYGKTPNFETTLVERLPFGSIELHLDASKGVIQRAKLFTDSLLPEVVEPADRLLEGKPYSSAGIRQARERHLQEVDSSHHHTVEQLYEWMAGSL